MAVSWAIPHCFGVPTLFLEPLPLRILFEGIHKKLVVFTFYGRFVGYSTLFWVPMPFVGALTLGTRFEGRHEKLVVFAFYGCFVGYSAMFWGPDAISRALNTW
jgi:hypothetical protein